MATSEATSRFSRSRGLPRAEYAAWVQSLRAHEGRPTRVLAWTHADLKGDPAFCIGSPAALSYGSTDSGWRHVGWHEVEHGGWNAELQSLTWTQLDGRRGSLTLADPVRLPELFRERVEATIVVKRFVPLSGERGVVISARRDLGGQGDMTWHTRLTRGLTWQTSGVQEAVAQALAETQAEYEVG